MNLIKTVKDEWKKAGQGQAGSDSAAAAGQQPQSALKSRSRILCEIAVTAVILLTILTVGPLDAFSHGYYCDAVDPYNIAAEDYLGYIGLEEAYSFSFTPARQHFRGFELIMVNIAQDDPGEIVLTISDNSGRVLDAQSVDIADMTALEYTILYIDASLQKGTTYTCTLEAAGSETVPRLILVDGDYLGGETEGDEILMGYAYAESTFSFPEKIMIAAFLLGLWLTLTAWLLVQKSARNTWYAVSLFLCLTTILTWNYMYYFFEEDPEAVQTFQLDSETLVSGMIEGERSGSLLASYGLGRYSDTGGEMNSYDLEYVNDGNWEYGYSDSAAQIIIDNTEYQQAVGAAGHYIEFANGDLYQISAQEEADDFLVLTLQTEDSINYYKNGDLADAVFYDEDMSFLSDGTVEPYESQYGLQGKIFRHLARLLDEDETYERLHFLCAFLMALTICLIVFLLRRRYNFLMAVCFYGTALLGCWIVYFARNLYWVEFTWFLPMLVGLFCSLHWEKRRCRLICYAGAFASVALKSLCGYEYISTIMVGLIAFPAADFAAALYRKEKKKARILFRTIFLLGIAAFLGFAAAFCLHAEIRGDGNLLAGFQAIYEEDFLRRMSGGGIGDFDESLTDSLNASAWEVVQIYFRFYTDVIPGIPGELFPLLSCLPIVIFLLEFRKGEDLRPEEPALYMIFLFGALSWFILGKSHSYVHTHINYVILYLGFIQVCLYILLRPIYERWKAGKRQEPPAQAAQTPASGEP